MTPDSFPALYRSADGSAADAQSTYLRVGLEKASTISIPCETPGEQADVGDGYPGFC